MIILFMTLIPRLFEEIPSAEASLEEILLYGTLPGIISERNLSARETDLCSYVETYLEEEIRAEAAVRNMGSFSRFLEIAAGESGKQLNFTRLSQDIGVADTTIANYYQILEDCLILSRIDPISKGSTKRRLIKSPKYLFFDLGIRRASAKEGIKLPQKIIGELFEHFIGNELIQYSQLLSHGIKVKYWRDSAGPEVDYVLDIAHEYIPIEVKWSDKPTSADARNLKKFIQDYPEVKQGYIICRTPHRYQLMDKIIVIPWQELKLVFN